jgi:Na+/proline symporter
MFGGMIIGSMMTMMLLGGASAADQVLANVQTLYVDQIDRPNTTTTLLLLITVSLLMGGLMFWPSKLSMRTKAFINSLRRHCK